MMVRDPTITKFSNISQSRITNTINVGQAQMMQPGASKTPSGPIGISHRQFNPYGNQSESQFGITIGERQHPQHEIIKFTKDKRPVSSYTLSKGYGYQQISQSLNRLRSLKSAKRTAADTNNNGEHAISG